MKSATHAHWEGPLEEEADTVRLAEHLAPHLKAGDLLILSGGLGAGKTFFSRALLHALGLDSDEPVTSPTFTLINEYPTEPPVLHADLYRLDSEEEVFELGLEPLRHAGNLLVVEWGAPFARVLGGSALYLDLALAPRRGKLHGTCSRSQEIIQAFLQRPL